MVDDREKRDRHHFPIFHCVRSAPYWLAVLLAGRVCTREIFDGVIGFVAPLDAPCKQVKSITPPKLQE